jgi:hypothetical protein
VQLLVDKRSDQKLNVTTHPFNQLERKIKVNK